MTAAELLTLVKQHCRIDADFTGDDDYLEQCIGAAKEAVAWQVDAAPEPETVDETDRSSEPTPQNEEGEEEEPTEDYDPPKAVLQALLLLVGEMYANREITGGSDKERPKSYDYLLSTKRRYTIA